MASAGIFRKHLRRATCGRGPACGVARPACRLFARGGKSRAGNPPCARPESAAKRCGNSRVADRPDRSGRRGLARVPDFRPYDQDGCQCRRPSHPRTGCRATRFRQRAECVAHRAGQSHCRAGPVDTGAQSFRAAGHAAEAGLDHARQSRSGGAGAADRRSRRSKPPKRSSRPRRIWSASPN